MMNTPVFVAASVYGADLVRQYGQVHFAEMAARAGAAGFEIRRELFPEGDIPFYDLIQSMKKNRLMSAYSVPFEIWNEQGNLNVNEISMAMEESKRLGVTYLKTTMGHYSPQTSDLGALKACLEDSRFMELPIHLTVENDQSDYAGKIRPIRKFLDDCAAEGIPARMTFDVGNWSWTGENLLEAAESLSEYVVYVHFKQGEERDGKRVAAPMSEDVNAEWRKILPLFGNDLPRVIEFPVIGDDLESLTLKYIQQLSQA